MNAYHLPCCRWHFALAGVRRGILIFCLLLLGPIRIALTADSLDFNRDIRPILADNCYFCHGPDAAHREADLRLDVRESAIAASAIVPGDPEASELIRRVDSQVDDLRMPPISGHKRLSAFQRKLLRQWIAAGADYQLHWSYVPPRKVEIPPSENAIDVLVAQRLGRVGLKAAAEADRRTLIRRLYADLLGLPPTPEQVARFEQDSEPHAYDDLVEKLLDNPHYGERMAMGWLDVVRFADTIGYHSDNPRNVWPYRDWVIHAFQTNKRFDRFTIEQIAGDLLEDADQESRIGSAFNRLLMSTEEGGAQAADYEQRMLTDRVRAIGTVWLGQTTGCAQCHDHKFDPFTMRDFYSLGAFFADIKEPIIGRREEGMVVLSEEQALRMAEFDAEIAKATEASQTVAHATTDDSERAPTKSDAQAAKGELVEQQSVSSALQKAIDARSKYYNELPKCLVTVSTAESRTVRILPRGNWMDKSGEVVQPALPQYLSPSVPGARALTRLDLAEWLVSRSNPLTARTVMNRLWKQLFGTGLSRVLDDLGAQGEIPVHAELLDWLACEFMDSGWDMKHMVRTIVRSATYKQASTATPELLAVDPNNRELARQMPFRLDAELVRDQALAVAGLLNPALGGPSVKPYQPEGYWESLNFPTRTYTADRGANQYRRGIYTWWQRSFLHPSLLAFDAPSREECIAERNRSNIPQQALVLLNDPSYVEAARALAIRVCTHTGESNQGVSAQICWVFQQVLQREPTADELRLLRQLYDERYTAYREDGAAANELVRVGYTPTPTNLDRVELAAWTHVARVLLNLHETITRS